MDTATYRARRQALRQSLGGGLILLAANDEASRNYPAANYFYRQDSTFLYYTGINRVGPVLVIFPGGEEVLYSPLTTMDDIIWMGPQPTPKEVAAGAGIESLGYLADLPTMLQDFRAKGGKVHYLPPYRGKQILKLADFLGTTPARIKAEFSPDLAAGVANQRLIKTPEEVASIEAALAITAQMYQAAFQTTRPGIKEMAVRGAMQGAALARDSQQSFISIISVNGHIFHNQEYHNTMEEGQLLVLDSGAESPDFYASDITRTIPVSGKFTNQQLRIYQVVLAAQLAAIAKAAPGISNKDLHLLAARTITEGLQEIGLMKGDPAAAVAAGAHALFFPHGLGHVLGLDVHDMEDLGDVVGYAPGEKRSEQFGLAYLRLARTLEPGYVLTVEPGIYFVPALIDLWAKEGKHLEFINYDRVEEYRDFGGIRIEDDILITDNGHRVLGPEIPKGPAEVEAALAK